jgi:hypothetical protein
MKTELCHVRPEFRYVRIDETKYWDKEFVKGLGNGTKIVATYIYDATERTFCCEITPSFFLRYAGTDIIPGRELSQEEFENALEIVSDNEVRCDNDHYRHCNAIKESFLVRHEYESIDEVLEDFSCNPW